MIPRGAKKSKNPPDQATGDAVAALAKLAVSKQSQSELVHGYTPLPPDLVKQANTAAGQIWTAPPLPPPTGGGQHQDVQDPRTRHVGYYLVGRGLPWRPGFQCGHRRPTCRWQAG